VRLWNPATGRPVGAPLHAGSAYLGGVFGMAFSPDGKLLASAAGDGTVRLWNLATRRPVGAPLQIGSGPASAGAPVPSVPAGARPRRAVPGGFALGPRPGRPDHGRLVAVFSPGGALIASCWSASPIVARP
jgi:WD40 repeat protein